jgi:optic atrophy 3 protein
MRAERKRRSLDLFFSILIVALSNDVISLSLALSLSLFLDHRLLKLGGLVVKTLAKPLSKQIKHEFSRYEVTQRLLRGIGETSHQITSRLTIWSAGYRVRNVKALEAEKALHDGAELLGEGFIFLFTGTYLVYEYNKSNEKSKEKEAAQKVVLLQERQELLSHIESLSNRLNQVETALETTQESLQKLVSLQLYYTGLQPPPPNNGAAGSASQKGSSGNMRIISIGENQWRIAGENDEKNLPTESSQQQGASAAAAAASSGRPWWRPW